MKTCETGGMHHSNTIGFNSEGCQNVIDGQNPATVHVINNQFISCRFTAATCPSNQTFRQGFLGLFRFNDWPSATGTA